MLQQLSLFPATDNHSEKNGSLKDNYYIEEIPYRLAMDIVIKNHYLHRKCPCSHAYGLIDKKTNEIKGVVTYGVSCSSTLLKGICGGAKPVTYMN